MIEGEPRASIANDKQANLKAAIEKWFKVESKGAFSGALLGGGNRWPGWRPNRCSSRSSSCNCSYHC